MTDIVERLKARRPRHGQLSIDENLMRDIDEAAAEIARLRSQVSGQWCEDMGKAPVNEYVLLWAPPENLSDKPDQEPEIVYRRAQDFCWATRWMRVVPPQPDTKGNENEYPQN